MVHSVDRIAFSVGDVFATSSNLAAVMSIWWAHCPSTSTCLLVLKLSFPLKMVTVSLVSVVTLPNRRTNVQFNKCVKEQWEHREAVSGSGGR